MNAKPAPKQLNGRKTNIPRPPRATSRRPLPTPVEPMSAEEAKKMNDLVEQTRRAANDDGAAAAEQSTPETPTGPKLMVNFNFVRGDGSSGADRAFLSVGLHNIRTERQIVQVEKLMMDYFRQQKRDYVRILITSWMPLEG